MGSILLVRHGQASFGAADYDALSELGVEQARRTGEALEDRRFDLVIAGAMRRHAQTAEAFGATPEIDTAWNEYDHLDVFKAPTFPESIARWMAAGGEYAETYAAFRARVQAGLKTLAARLGKGQSAIVFTSGGPIALVASELLGVTPARALDLQWTLVNAGVTKLIVGKDGVRVSTVNEHHWLSGPLLTYR
jgi:broad specificity phosphatase PhoE